MDVGTEEVSHRDTSPARTSGRRWMLRGDQGQTWSLALTSLRPRSDHVPRRTSDIRLMGSRSQEVIFSAGEIVGSEGILIAAGEGTKVGASKRARAQVKRKELEQ